MAASRFLFFVPFGSWIVHTQLDCVLAAALANRGADVKLLGCDRQFEGCLAAGTPPSEEACAACHQTSQDWFQKFQLPVTWLSALITAADRQDAEAWAQTVDLRQEDAPLFDGQPIARWVKLAVFSALRSSRIPTPESAAYARPRQILVHGALIARATVKMLRDYQPDAVVCYSGTNGYYRVFVELARLSGCRVLVHERGGREGAFQLVPDRPTYEMFGRAHPGWDEWAKAPLSVAQLQDIIGCYDDRVLGQNTNFQVIHRYQTAPVKTRDRLRLPADGRPVVLATCSGDWEFGMLCAYGGIHVLWKSQLAWLEYTAAICKRRGWQLIIRQHPLGAGKPAYPRATPWLSELLRDQPWLDDSIRVIMPGENTSTYDLFEIADVVVAQASRTPAEALVRGVPSICVTSNPLQLMGLHAVARMEDLEADLEAAIARSPCVSVDELRAAYRHAYFRAFVVANWAFKSVRIKDVYQPDLTLSRPEELVPGADPALDRACEHLIHGSPLYPPPVPAPESEETAYLTQRREALLEQRLAIRSAARPVHPSVGILTEQMPATWRCRHSEVVFHLQALPSAADPARMLTELARLAQQIPQPYLGILTPHVRWDECFIARGVDELELPEHRDKAGVVFGCYVLEEDGTVGPEWNTPLNSIHASELPPADVDALHRPGALLSLVVWRKEAFIRWSQAAARELLSCDAAAATLLAKLTSGADFVNIDEPVVYFHHIASRQSLLEQVRSADPSEQEATADLHSRYANLYGNTSKISHAVAEKQHEARKHEDALNTLQAIYDAHQAGPETWQLLGRILPEAATRKAFSPVPKSPGSVSSNGLRFLQLHTFYPAYLAQLYASQPRLFQMDYEDQLSVILADGFGAAHMWAPVLKAQGHEAMLVIGNNVVSQFQWAAENLQALKMKKKSAWLHEIALQQVEHFDPDVLYLGDPVTFDMNFVRRLKKRPKWVVAWRAAPSPDTVDWSGIDLMLSHLPPCLQEAREKGVRETKEFYPGFPRWVADEVAETQPEYDLVFCGQWSDAHEKRNNLISKLAKAALSKEHPFSFGLFLESADPSKLPEAVRKLNQGGRWGMDMYRTLRKGRVALNAEINMGRGHAGNMRLFEATGCGVCTLTEHHSNISRYFQPDEEVVTFKGADDCLGKLRQLMADDSGRRAIAAAGQQRCLGEHAIERRMEQLAALLKQPSSGPAAWLRRTLQRFQH